MKEIKERKIIFIDQISEFDTHMILNASLLKIILQIFNKSIDYYSIESNKESVFQLLSTEQKKQILFYPLTYSKTKQVNIIFKLYYYFKKELLRYNSFKSILKKTTQKDIIFLGTTTFTTFLVLKLLKRKYQQPVIAFLHGETGFLYKKETYLDKLIGFCYKINFKINAKNFYYCALNKISKEILIADGFLRENELLEINHPIELLNNSEKELKNNQNLVLGHIGSLEFKRKNSHLFYKLALNFKNEVQKNNITFKAIGLSTPNMKPFKNKWVQDIVGNNAYDSPKYLDRSNYETAILNLKYVLFFYPENEYIFRASGVSTDAIALQIPIITLRHPYFEYLFKIGGDIGYICNNYKELEILVEEILHQKTFNTEKYKNQVLNLKKLYKNFSVVNITKDLKNQMITHNII